MSLKEYAQPKPFHVKVSKNSKGYTWEVSVSGDTPREVLDQLHVMEMELAHDYGTTTSSGATEVEG